MTRREIDLVPAHYQQEKGANEILRSGHSKELVFELFIHESTNILTFRIPQA